MPTRLPTTAWTTARAVTNPGFYALMNVIGVSGLLRTGDRVLRRLGKKGPSVLAAHDCYDDDECKTRQNQASGGQHADPYPPGDARSDRKAGAPHGRGGRSPDQEPARPGNLHDKHGRAMVGTQAVRQRARVGRHPADRARPRQRPDVDMPGWRGPDERLRRLVIDHIPTALQADFARSLGWYPLE